MKPNAWITPLLFILMLAQSTGDQETPSSGTRSWEELRARPYPQWFTDAKLGIFIHWGVYSVLGGEWKGEDYGKEIGWASAEWIKASEQSNR